MASTTAMFTGLSGLTANARSLDVIGNNIANVNTTAFKSNRMLFSTNFARTFSLGSEPTANNGGTNPGQVGLGVGIAGTQRDFSGGAISATGDLRDLALEGDGFFIVRRGAETLFTRAGAFRSNSENQLVTISGERVQGFGVDGQFNLVPGRLVDLTIPVGTLTLAEATRNVRLAGNLNASGALPTQGSMIALSPFSLLGGPIGGPGGPLLDVTSTLADIQDPLAPGTPLFAAGQMIELTGAEKGTKTLPAARMPIGIGSTVQNLIDFLTQALGIETGAGPNPDGQAPGVHLDAASGQLRIVGNTGVANDLALDVGDLRVVDAAGAVVRQPFAPQKLAAADGESVRTSFVVFDSLGTPVDVDVTMVLESRGAGDGGGTTWRYFVESGDDSDLALQVGTGVVTFDGFGQVVGEPAATVSIDRIGSGAASPLQFMLAFASPSDQVTGLSSINSALAAVFQDGSPLGSLAAYSVGVDGLITGAFTNGLTRTIGQVALAQFANPEGLVDAGANMFTIGPNSGAAVITTPMQLGAGRVVGGALELSNVELSQEFINLILASTGYSAASRVITTTDQLFQQLLVLGR